MFLLALQLSHDYEDENITGIYSDLIQILYFFITETTFLTIYLEAASEGSESNLLPLRFNGVWQTNACVSAPPAGLECEAESFRTAFLEPCYF